MGNPANKSAHHILKTRLVIEPQTEPPQVLQGGKSVHQASKASHNVNRLLALVPQGLNYEKGDLYDFLLRLF